MTSPAPSRPHTHAPSAGAPWYVAHTRPRQEHVAMEQLQHQDFDVYLPLFRVLKKASASVVHEPMFPRYLFLRPTRATQSLSVVRSTVGINRLVMFGQQPATLADEAIAAIREAESLRETASLAQISRFRPGMAVRLLDPALAGLQGLVQSVSKDRVTLLLEILGRPQSVQVEFGRITRV